MSSCPAIGAAETTASMPVSLPDRSSVIDLRIVTAAISNKLGLAGQWTARACAYVLASVWFVMTCKAIIGLVSAFDTYLTIKYAQSLDVYEQNPLGRWLMGLDQGPVADTQQIAAFITAKFIGTLLVMIIIQGLAYWRMRVAGLVALPVAIAQLYLMLHLMLGQG